MAENWKKKKKIWSALMEVIGISREEREFRVGQRVLIFDSFCCCLDLLIYYFLDSLISFDSLILSFNSFIYLFFLLSFFFLWFWIDFFLLGIHYLVYWIISFRKEYHCISFRTNFSSKRLLLFHYLFDCFKFDFDSFDCIKFLVNQFNFWHFFF